MDICYISSVNLKRCLRWHPAGLKSWSLSDWFTAFAGEVGEMGNVIKKLNRVRDGMVGNKETPEELSRALGKEIADCYIYLDLLAQAADVDLEEVVRLKFNEVSVRNGFPERL
jgi:NTP pyrophosphatase (non-canonical NTP hydrolase)